MLTPFIISSLGKTGYGIWTLVGSFTGYYGLVNLGIGSAVTRYVASYAGQKNGQALNETAGTALLTFSCTGFFVAFLSFVAAEPLASYFRVSPAETASFVQVVRLLGVATGLSFVAGVYTAVMNAFELFVLSNIINVVSALIRAGLIVVLLKSGFGLFGVAVSTLISIFCSLAACMLGCRSLIPEVRFSVLLASRSNLMVLVRYGLVTTVIVIADILRSDIDAFVVARWVSVQDVSIYSVATTLIKLMVSITTAGMGVLLPRFSMLYGDGDDEKLRKLFLQSISIASFISFGTAVIAILYGGSFIHVWVGKQFFESNFILQILAISTAFAIAQNPGIGFMYALKKHHYYAVITLCEGIANFLLSIFLAGRFGVLGVALGTMITMLISKIFFMPAYVSRIAGISLGTYWKAIAAPAVVATSLVGLARIISFSEIDHPDYFKLILFISFTALVYMAACLTLMGREERNTIISFFPRFKKQVI